LLRERKPDVESGDDCEFEVLMAKRHKDSKFMSEHHVFPGGSIDVQDSTKVSRARLVGVDDSVINNLKDVCYDPAFLWIGATREVFEEVGILIATQNTVDLMGKIESKTKKLKKYQKKLQKDKITMTDIMVKEHLYYSASSFRYFGRFITPELSPIRFDTQFFLCKFPTNQNINLFQNELTESIWGSPKQLIKHFKKKEIKLIFPQYSTLKRLRKFKTIQDLFDNSQNFSTHNRLR
jgi:8-oxo-dGTP pyrophosphatase MutT (NUDIX family)